MLIQRIVEVPLSDLQTEKAKKMDITISQVCCICGKPINDMYQAKFVQLLENGNIVSTNEPIEGSQGFFPVGNDCAKKLVLNFAF